VSRGPTGLKTTLLPYLAYVDVLRRHGVGVLMVLALILMVNLAYDPEHTDRLRAQESELSRLEELNADLIEQHERRAAELKAMKEDPSFVVYLARRDLGMVRPGEIVYEFGSARD